MIKPFEGMEKRYMESQIKKTMNLQIEEENKEREHMLSQYHSYYIDLKQILLIL